MTRNPPQSIDFNGNFKINLPHSRMSESFTIVMYLYYRSFSLDAFTRKTGYYFCDVYSSGEDVSRKVFPLTAKSIALLLMSCCLII